MIASYLLLQAAAAAPTGLPDIQFEARARARQVRIEREGEARLTVTASPDGGSIVDVQAPRANARRELRNVEVRVKAEARIGDPGQAPQHNQQRPETEPPQSR